MKGYLRVLYGDIVNMGEVLICRELQGRVISWVEVEMAARRGSLESHSLWCIGRLVV